MESEKQNQVDDLTRLLNEQIEINKDLEITLKGKVNCLERDEEKIKNLTEEINNLVNEKDNIEMEFKKHLERLEENNAQLNLQLENRNRDIEKLTRDNAEFVKVIEDKTTGKNSAKENFM